MTILLLLLLTSFRVIGTVPVTTGRGATNVNQPLAEFGFNHIPAKWGAAQCPLEKLEIPGTTFSMQRQ